MRRKCSKGSLRVLRMQNETSNVMVAVIMITMMWTVIFVPMRLRNDHDEDRVDDISRNGMISYDVQPT